MRKSRLLAILLVIMLACALTFTLAACDNGETPSNGEDNNGTQQSGGTTDGNNNTDSESKILIAYFSCTNNTENVAKYIQEITGGTLYEITPAVPYTSADLNYNNSSSRSSIEQNDSTCRPEISGSVEDFEEYDIIFIGYPIWWGQAPKIIYTFLESYDFTGKVIVPFCTSASSGLGTSASNLHSFAITATWKDGKRFAASASRSSVEDWIKGLEL